jgi:plasmid maintenance system antidote protein VapI
MPMKMLSVSESLRKAIAESGLSFQALERETGVLRQSLMKFARGEQSLRLDMADRLAAYFGLELIRRKGKGK